jgi:hypothetical protein
LRFLADRFLLRLVVRFALLYGAIFTLAWTFSLFHWTELAVVGVANRQLTLIEPAEVSRRIVVEAGGDLLQYLSTGPGSAIVRIAGRDSGYVSHNLFLFVALVLASPGLPWRRRLGALGIGLGLIFLLDTLVVMGEIWQGDRLNYPGARPEVWSGSLAHVLHVISALHPTGGMFMLPVFVWGLALLARPLFATPGPEGRVGRNQPCPCGSGRKYKMCCGGSSGASVLIPRS